MKLNVTFTVSRGKENDFLAVLSGVSEVDFVEKIEFEDAIDFKLYKIWCKAQGLPAGNASSLEKYKAEFKEQNIIQKLRSFKDKLQKQHAYLVEGKHYEEASVINLAIKNFEEEFSV